MCCNILTRSRGVLLWNCFSGGCSPGERLYQDCFPWCKVCVAATGGGPVLLLVTLCTPRNRRGVKEIYCRVCAIELLATGRAFDTRLAGICKLDWEELFALFATRRDERAQRGRGLRGMCGAPYVGAPPGIGGAPCQEGGQAEQGGSCFRSEGDGHGVCPEICPPPCCGGGDRGARCG